MARRRQKEQMRKEETEREREGEGGREREKDEIFLATGIHRDACWPLPARRLSRVITRGEN